jgi:AraC family transcriptional regulator
MHLPIRHRLARTSWITLHEFFFPPNFCVPAHAHAPPHMLVMLGGALVEHDAGHERQCEAGAMRYSPAADQHAVRIADNGAHCLIVEARGFPELRLVRRVYFEDTDASQVIAPLRQTLFDCPNASPAEIETRALTLFTSVRDRMRPTRLQHPLWIEDGMNYLNAMSPSREPLAELARSVGRAPSLVARAFRARFGVSVHRHYRRRQIDRAWALMASGGMSLSTIATTCGFTDQSHFTRAFRRETGESPGEASRRAPNGWNWYATLPFEEMTPPHR